LLGVIGLVSYGANGRPSGEQIGETFVEPPVVSSKAGVLDTTLKVEMVKTNIGGREVTLRAYNGLYIPPTLRVRPGDTIRLRVVNAIDRATNVHYHGMHVSPRGNSDNVFLHLRPGEAFDYRVVIPKSQSPGLYWYHSHAHYESAYQVMSGMSGAIIVEGLLDPLPELRGIRERVMLLKDIQITSAGTVPTNISNNTATTRTINGRVAPTITIRPGETQLWRIGNISANIYYRLRLDGHTMYEIARDGDRQNQPIRREEVLLPAASRTEVLVQGGPPGVYQLRTLGYDTGPAGNQYPEVVLATLISRGDAQHPVVLPSRLPPVEDLRTRPIARKRVIVFSETADGNTYYINGKAYDPNRIDTEAELGDLEEWTIRNDSDEDHTFHIHQTDFQVVEDNGKSVSFTGYRETMNVLRRGSIKLLIPFTDPVIVGKFVYHCHILNHEDKGMMATIVVRDSKLNRGRAR
jgi:FtsP/CotA-like multicopper oxidase with cupredoxin domain